MAPPFLSMKVALRKESVDRNISLILSITLLITSLSARRAWIEICVLVVQVLFDGSLSARRAWIEICVLVVQVLFDGSLSARRAWIEIAAAGALSRPRAVALRKESVDRNTLTVRNCSGADLVALRKESVDRNSVRES